MERFGIFVEFLPGKQGLVHVSEFATGEGLDDFKVDDKLDVILAGVSHLLPAILNAKPYGPFSISNASWPEFYMCLYIMPNKSDLHNCPYIPQNCIIWTASTSPLAKVMVHIIQ